MSQPSTLLQALLSIGMALHLLINPIAAHAKAKSSQAQTAEASLVKKKSTSKVTYKHKRSDSEETSAERDRRLYRECKGMHNAGACKGYTR
ncbi:MAG: hypothetical protein QM569_04330 [Acidovorax sp.]|uniref:hypothetical protein n=1 Tax=Acidovorax sp. TaxID=1872122 RepID=UPI0039E26CD7